MATVTHKITSSVQSSSGSVSLTGYDSEAGNSEIIFDQTFSASTVNQSITLALTAADLQAVFLVSPQGCTIKTNSTGSPNNTITLEPNIPVIWGASNGLTCPFTADVTVAYVSCTPAARLQMKILTN
jgi:hypothetical protein